MSGLRLPAWVTATGRDLHYANAELRRRLATAEVRATAWQDQAETAARDATAARAEATDWQRRHGTLLAHLNRATDALAAISRGRAFDDAAGPVAREGV